MNNKVDIVVTYLDDTEPSWRENYNYWKSIEINNNIANPNSKQAFGEERLRNWNFTHYWFRGVEQNCPWVNKVFFVVQNEKQVPKWLDTTNPKLRIVYHDEFIPKELLPTFSGMTVGLFISQIPDLSDNYIMCDDDYFFLNPIEEEKFFIDNVPQHEDNSIPYGYFYDGDEFLHILNNNFDFEKKYIKDNIIKYHFYHLPSARKKSFEQKIIKENYQIFINAQKPSKFRYKTNLDANLFVNILKLSGEANIQPRGTIYSNDAYIALKSGIDFYQYKDKNMVCFNDVDLVNGHFEEISKDLNKFLEYKFPNKSSFEK